VSMLFDGIKMVGKERCGLCLLGMK
jgi:hypothetical protein